MLVYLFEKNKKLLFNLSLMNVVVLYYFRGKSPGKAAAKLYVRRFKFLIEYCLFLYAAILEEICMLALLSTTFVTYFFLWSHMSVLDYIFSSQL